MDLHQIDLSLNELNHAVKLHYEWTGKFLELVLLGREPDNSFIHPQSHLSCRFCQWMTRCDNSPSRYARFIENISKAHQTMHDTAHTLIRLIADKQVGSDELYAYHDAQQQFVASIDDYRQQLISLRNRHDMLTGLPLRQLLYEDFDFLHNSAREQALWLLIIDIDRFKKVNDTYGHNAGDDVLREVAQRLKSEARDGERVYRFGGEEFIALLAGHTQEEAREAGLRLCGCPARLPITLNDESLQVTVTGGLTGIRRDETLHEAIGRADDAMYFGKNNGRNRCILTLDGLMRETLK
ncbi:COG2199: FOG: GGDEF domain [Cronobacter universalis NCTC 9529]|uniref:diguanylate cyclase n=1 Tax=Cronobacter universalis NCTC 9529 TaxID=1074000 RepID=A0AAC8VMJ1_9ENTR|nr:diguanylate cyclase [Cronobacter universalis]ALB53582.1 diguanylate cyclase [Cronobacter universalis NCTC 9529]CCK17222.1 COG2199: FOG: GGDEF domain [Cronobacter universalis NCTC 9529]STC98935.1 Diguanylate cyclase YdeH [Cronobacter universalis NCTC 9529]